MIITGSGSNARSGPNNVCRRVRYEGFRTFKFQFFKLHFFLRGFKNIPPKNAFFGVRSSVKPNTFLNGSPCKISNVFHSHLWKRDPVPGHCVPRSHREDVALVVLPDQVLEHRRVVDERVQLVGLHSLEALLHGAAVEAEKRGGRTLNTENEHLKQLKLYLINSKIVRGGGEAVYLIRKMRLKKNNKSRESSDLKS